MTSASDAAVQKLPTGFASSGDCAVFDWIENLGRYADGIPSLVTEVCNRFVSCDLPLERVSIVMRTLHPQIAVSGYVWRHGASELSTFNADHQSQSRESYQSSPVRPIFEGSPDCD